MSTPLNTVTKPQAYMTYSGLIIEDKVLRMVLKTHDNYAKFIKSMTLELYQKISGIWRGKSYSYRTIGGNKCIVLPRPMCIKLAKLFDIQFLWGTALNNITVDIIGKLKEEQQILVDYFVEKVYTPQNIAVGGGSLICNVMPGCGKSYIIGGLIGRLKYRTLVIVPKKPLAVQMIKDLNQMIKTGIGKYSSKKREVLDVCVCVINSALNMPEDYIKNYSVVIFDECHTLCSEARIQIFRKANLPLMLGLSGTTNDREDKKDPLLWNEMAIDGKVLHATDVPGFSYGDDVKFIMEVTIVNYYGPPEYTQTITTNGICNSKATVDQLYNDPYRMGVAIRYLKQLIAEGHYIYVFADEKEPLTKMFTEFSKHFPVDAPEVASVHKFNGDTKERDIASITAGAQVLLTTYGYAGTGISINHYTAILFYSPRKANMRQICARIRRRGSDLSIKRRIVDIVDKNTIKKYQSSRRMDAYNHYEMEITTDTVRWNEEIK